MSDLEFWQEVYIATIRTGRGHADAEYQATKALSIRDKMFPRAEYVISNTTGLPTLERKPESYR